MFRRILRTVSGVLVGGAIFLLTIELVLALAPDLLPPRLGNYAFSKYGDFPGGMYFHDEASGIHFLRRDFETEAYFNGYRWRHVTDSLGFRNPPDLLGRSLLLLGDSMIYGHGVEETDTVGHFLRTDHGLAAYNMARQGDTLYQQYVLSRLYAKQLDARIAVLFVFLNDFHDLELYRDHSELVERPEASWDYNEVEARLIALDDDPPRNLEKLVLGLPSVRLLRGVVRNSGPISLIAVAEAATQSSSPAYVEPLLDPDRYTRLASYYQAAIADLRDRLAGNGIELRLVELDVGPALGERAAIAQQRLGALVAELCAELELTCGSTRDLFIDCTDCFLPQDGHLSPAGHRRLAAFLADDLSRQSTAVEPMAQD